MKSFDPELYRQAVALLTARLHNDDRSVQVITDEAGVALVLPLADLLGSALAMVADERGETVATVLSRMGEFAAMLAG